MYAVSGAFFYTLIVAGLAVAYTYILPWTLALLSFIPAYSPPSDSFGLIRTASPDLGASRCECGLLEKGNISLCRDRTCDNPRRETYRYTAGHSAAVAIYARDIAIRMGLPKDESDKAHWPASYMTSARSGCLLECLRSLEH